MKKTLAILLLLLLVAGCGKNDQTSESSPQKPPAPTLADSFQGQRIHFEVQDQHSDRKETFWLQLGENNQVTIGDHSQGDSAPYAIKESKLIVRLSNETAAEMRFSKVDLAVGDQVTLFRHRTENGNLRALLDSTDDSAAKETALGSITKIEAAQRVDPRPQSPASDTPLPVTGTITYDGKPLADARIRLDPAAGGPSRVYACDSRADGTFVIEAVYSTEVQQGAPVGNYKVLVAKFEKDTAGADNDDPDADEAAELELIEALTEDGPDVVQGAPLKSQVSETFNNASTTPLKLEVKEGKNSFRIDLKSDGTGTVKAL